MANRQMAFQWSHAKVVETAEKMNSFIKLSGVDDELEMLDEAMQKCNLDEKTKKEFQISKQIAKALLEKNLNFKHVRLVIGWRAPGETYSYTLEVEYSNGKPKSVVPVT